MQGVWLVLFASSLVCHTFVSVRSSSVLTLSRLVRQISKTVLGIPHWGYLAIHSLGFSEVVPASSVEETEYTLLSFPNHSSNKLDPRTLQAIWGWPLELGFCRSFQCCYTALSSPHKFQLICQSIQSISLCSSPCARNSNVIEWNLTDQCHNSNTHSELYSIACGLLAAFLSQYWALRYRPKWFEKYNYVLSRWAINSAIHNRRFPLKITWNWRHAVWLCEVRWTLVQASTLWRYTYWAFKG